MICVHQVNPFIANLHPVSKVIERNETEPETEPEEPNLDEVGTEEAESKKVPPASRDFIMEVTKGKGEKLGVDLDFGEPEVVPLRVKGVKPGIISDWNDKNPLNKLEVGDGIVAINGASKDAAGLLEKVLTDTTLVMHIKKAESIAKAPA